VAAYQQFTFTRTTPIDLQALMTTLRSTVAPDVGPQPPINNTIILKKGTPWTPAEITAAQTAINTAPEPDPADADARLRLTRAMVAYIWRVTHAGVNPTPAQLQGEMDTFKTIYKAIPAP